MVSCFSLNALFFKLIYVVSLLTCSVVLHVAPTFHNIPCLYSLHLNPYCMTFHLGLELDTHLFLPPTLIGILSQFTMHPHLHLHFYIRDANADAGTTPNGPCLF